ncbi:MAG: hypothetical protein ACRCZP_09780, partial [Phycicoccus sp.]
MADIESSLGATARSRARGDDPSTAPGPAHHLATPGRADLRAVPEPADHRAADDDWDDARMTRASLDKDPRDVAVMFDDVA